MLQFIGFQKSYILVPRKGRKMRRQADVGDRDLEMGKFDMKLEEVIAVDISQ